MKEQIISFETARLAKEKGFDITNRNSYDENTGVMLPKDPYGHCYALEGTCPAATQSLLQKWLREIYQIDITVITNWSFSIRTYRIGLSYVLDNKIEIWFSKKENKISLFEYNTYEEALEMGLQEALKLIENESTNN